MMPPVWPPPTMVTFLRAMLTAPLDHVVVDGQYFDARDSLEVVGIVCDEILATCLYGCCRNNGICNFHAIRRAYPCCALRDFRRNDMEPHSVIGGKSASIFV